MRVVLILIVTLLATAQVGIGATSDEATEASLSKAKQSYARLVSETGAGLLQAMEAKMEKNAVKYPADRVRGSSKKYSEYSD